LPLSELLKLTGCGKRVPVLAILDADTDDAAAKMLQIGCRGVLPNRFTSKLFRRAMAKMLEGEIWANGRVVANLVSDMLRASTSKDNALTPLEGVKNNLIL